MYYFIMYGSLLVGLIALLISGIYMVITPADKLKVTLKPGQSRDVAVRNVRKQGKLCIAGCILIILLIVGTVWSVDIENIPEILF